MKKKILVLGAAGMLGHMVYLYFKQNTDYILIGTSRNKKIHKDIVDLDVNAQDNLHIFFRETKPDVVINCIGVLISGSNRNIKNAIYINSYLPHYLSELSNINDAKLIHISTDCVFSGSKGNYVESDETDGKDIYAKTKALGELINDKDLTLRTSIIGPELKNGEGLLHWFLNQKGKINGYTNAYWSGVTTLELARVIQSAFEKDLRGLYHVTNGIPINKFELLKILNLFFPGTIFKSTF